jgi:hypothetical protein
MKTSILLCGALLLASSGVSTATDYPLAFKTLDAHQAFSFPSGTTIYGLMSSAKPAGIVKAPPAVSSFPLYGQIAVGGDQMLFRLDESKGNGRGYDRLIVDVNRNGDLTDDPVVNVVPPDNRNGVVIGNQMLFGPIQAPDNLMIGSNRPICFAEVIILNTAQSLANMPANVTAGEIILKTGWYLQATVDVDGKQHKVDVVDANCNFHIGDPEKAVIARTAVAGGTAANGSQTSWSFQGGDLFMVDWDGVSSVQDTLLGDRTSPFGPLLYFGAKPYKAALSADCKTLSLEAWPEPMAELALQPHGEFISTLRVGWEKTPGEWVLLQPGVENGKAKVPPGNYRLYSVGLKAKTSSGESLILSGTKRTLDGAIKAATGESTPLMCGAPLKLSLTATPAREAVNSVGSALSSLFSQSSGATQTIQTSILGSGGETYSVPYLLNKGGATRQPPSPVFTVLTAEGKQADSGSLEYG